MSSDDQPTPDDPQSHEPVLRACKLLSRRQHQFTSLYARGLCTGDICVETGAPESTIHNEVLRAMRILGTSKRSQLAPFFGNPKPEFRNLVTLLQRSVKRFGERPLFAERRASGWHWTTYSEFGALVESVRGILLRNRVWGNVAVISKNRLEWALGAYATYGLAPGGCYVPVHDSVSDELLEHMLTDCRARGVLVADDATRRRVERLRSRLPELRAILNFQTLLGEYAAPHASVSKSHQHGRPPLACNHAVRLYVFDREGTLKPVQLTHRNLASSTTSVLRRIGKDRPERGLLHLPFAHVLGGCMELNLTIASGSCVAICEDPVRVGDYMPEVRPTRLFAPPAMLERMAQSVLNRVAHLSDAAQRTFRAARAARSRERRGLELGSRELAAITAAEQPLFAQLRQLFGGELRTVCAPTPGLSSAAAELMSDLGLDVYVGYSRVEVSGLATVKRYDGSTSGSLGPPIDGVEVEIVRPPGQECGEVVFKGQCVTDDSIVSDGIYGSKLGWRSGALGRIDASGELHIEKDCDYGSPPT